MENKSTALMNVSNSFQLQKKETDLLDSFIESIIQERDRQAEFILISGYDDVQTSVNTHIWPKLFVHGFLDNSVVSETVDETRDDLLFYVTNHIRTQKKPGLQVFRRNSPKLPNPTDQHINWEETVYLNLLMQYFIYVVTVAVCTRTGPQEWQILKKFSQVVYASPSHRQMDKKGNKQEIAYPDLYFNIDNYEEVFADCILHDSESLSVELTAYDRSKKIRGVCFLGTISYDTLKKVYDSKSNFRSGMLFNRAKYGPGSNSAYLSSSPVHNSIPTKFIRVVGPQSKGSTELAVTSQIDSDQIIAEISKWDNSLAPTSLVTRCCQTMQGQPDAHFSPANGYTISSDIHGPVITEQPKMATTDDPKSIPQHLHSSRTLCRPSPWSVKSAGASADTSPVRYWKLPSLTHNSSTTTLYDRHGFIGNSKSKTSGVPTTHRKNSRISEILSSFTGPSTETQPQVTFAPGGFDQTTNQNGLVDHCAIQMRTTSFDPSVNPDHQGEIPFAHADKRHHSFGQAWSWFKERRRLTSVGLRTNLTYISLTCQSILIDLLEVRQEPILTFTNCQLSKN